MDSIRQTVAKEIYNLAKNDLEVVALTADLSSSVGFDPIKNDLPNQFIECGIAEQQMLSMASGLSLSGFKPFAASYAEFHPGRNWDQLRTSVCYNQTPVRLISSHYGLTVGGDGATHQNLEYLSLTLCLPNLSIFLPFNNTSAKWSINQMYTNNDTPSILFQPREKQSEEIERVSIDNLSRDGFVIVNNQTNTPSSVLIITGGMIASEAFKLYFDKESPPIDFIFLVKLDSLDTEKLGKVMTQYKKIVIVEEHQKYGGLGSIVFEILSINGISIDVNHLCLDRKFGKSGLNYTDLWDYFNISSKYIRASIN